VDVDSDWAVLLSVTGSLPTFTERYDRAGEAEVVTFLMADVGRDTVGFAKACLAKGIAVGRPFPPLTSYSRISIGTMEEMQRACDVFTSVLRA